MIYDVIYDVIYGVIYDVNNTQNDLFPMRGYWKQTKQLPLCFIYVLRLPWKAKYTHFGRLASGFDMIYDVIYDVIYDMIYDVIYDMIYDVNNTQNDLFPMKCYWKQTKQLPLCFIYVLRLPWKAKYTHFGRLTSGFDMLMRC